MRDLAQLIIEINKRHHEAEAAGTAFLKAAIECGEALNEAYDQIHPTGTWPAWREANLDVGKAEANHYMRVAFYKDMIPASATSLVAAIQALAGLPPIRKRGLPAPPPALLKRAKALRAEGLTWRAVADELDVTPLTAMSWGDPAYDKTRRAGRMRRERRRREAAGAVRRERKREEREQAIREAGGKLENVYALVRRALQTMDAAIGECEDPAVRAGLRQTLLHGHRWEDGIFAALKGKDFAAATRRYPSDPV